MNQYLKRYLHPFILVPMLFLVTLFSLCCYLYCVGRPVASFNSNNGIFMIWAPKLEWEKKVERFNISWLTNIANNTEVALSSDIHFSLHAGSTGVFREPFPEHLSDQVTRFTIGWKSGNPLNLSEPVDLPVFPNLKIFEVYGRPDWNAAGYLEYLEGCENLDFIFLDGNDLTIEPEKALTEFLSSHQKLSSLCISGYPMDSKPLDMILSKTHWNTLSIDTKHPLNDAQLELLLDMRHLKSMGPPAIGNLQEFLTNGHYPEMDSAFFCHHDFRDLDVNFLRLFPNITQLGIFDDSEINLNQLSHLKKSKQPITLRLDSKEIDIDQAKKLFLGSRVHVVE